MTSKIKVDNISDQNDNNIINESGDVITVGAAGDTVAVAGNIVKSNALQASDGGNLVNQSGTTITLGASGDTVSLASGASQSGFGRAGSVDWQTSIKTGDFTAANGEGYFINTTSGAITMTLPSSPSVGDIVALKDYANTFDTNNLTINRNSQPISGTAANSIVSTEGQALTLVYGDSTKGWQSVAASTESDLPKPSFVVASGGTVTTCGNFKVHTFTGPGTFTVSDAGNAVGSNSVDYLVVAGGGGSGADAGGGSGGGGLRFSNSTFTNSGPSSPRNGGTALPVTATGYPVTVGGGGAGTPDGNAGAPGTKGTDSSFAGSSTITSTGGGFGGGVVPGVVGGPGGSGGGGRANEPPGGAGTGNSPPTNPAQGSNGGATGGSPGKGGGGGGGFIAVGTNGSGPGPGNGGDGGSGGGFPAAAFGPANGQQNTGTGPAAPGTPDGFRYFAGGGHGGSVTGCLGNTPACNGALGGGGVVKAFPNAGGAGVTNTGGGGSAGTGNDKGGGAGGSGIVVIRYKFQ